MTTPSLWDLLDILAAHRASWSPLLEADPKVRTPFRLFACIVCLRILAETDRDRMALTFYRGNEWVHEDPDMLLEHMRAAGAENPVAPKSVLDLAPTMVALNGAAHLLELERDEAVMLSFITPTAFVELEFFDDHIEYSVFNRQDEPARWEDLVAALKDWSRE